MPKANVRGMFGMVLQDTWIFKGTVRENISYAKPDATLEEVEEAARRAQATSFIERLPQKYDTVISASSGLSEGEKQLISIARVLLMNPDMIILDEATSSLDAVSERISLLLSQNYPPIELQSLSHIVYKLLSTLMQLPL